MGKIELRRTVPEQRTGGNQTRSRPWRSWSTGRFAVTGAAAWAAPAHSWLQTRAPES